MSIRQSRRNATLCGQRLERVFVQRHDGEEYTALRTAASSEQDWIDHPRNAVENGEVDCTPALHPTTTLTSVSISPTRMRARTRGYDVFCCLSGMQYRYAYGAVHAYACLVHMHLR